jgi:cellulose biosynthesis protein BcsQ
LVDLDPQANATVAVDPPEIKFTTNDLLAGAPAVLAADAITATGWGPAISVIPGEPALAVRNTDGKLGEHRLRTALKGLADVDLIIIDCPPNLGPLTTNALAASDLAVVVTEPTMFSVAGAHQSLAGIDLVRQRFNLRLQPAGLVVNRARLQSPEHRFRIDELLAAYRDLVLIPVMPELRAAEERSRAGRRRVPGR